MRRILGGLATVFLVVAIPMLAQRAGSGSSAGSGSNAGGGLGSVSRSPTSNVPSTTSNNPSSPGVWQNSGAIFLSGRVMFDDGMKPNSDIRIERLCSGGVTRLEAHTDSRGQFSFQVGQTTTVDTDASDNSSGGYGRPGTGFGTSGSNLGTSRGLNNSSSTPLQGCELRASYPGYRSDLLELSNHRSTDEPNVGTIILHRLGGSAAGTISLNSALVPKKASREYEKGVQFAEKGKFEEAEKHFEGATREYPKYAIAWFALGQLQQRDGSSAAAMKSFEAAIEADAKYASPYDQLALMSAQGQQWEAAAKYSSEAIALDSVDYPSCFWYNALANYHLKKTAEAEKSLAELLQKDKVHRYPQAENMFAQLLLEEGKYAEAAQHLREYLRLAPDAKDAGAAKELLAKLDKAQPPPSH